ncbi:MAG: crossover junction endodeoxyribonuclease RuvC [Flavobacteriaceae bacterium]|nr:crossover junction endodeoxyribonuclease RuvC [Flavobacteriaceae bacterium]MCY4217373.1 crossover junction endodeoxyribonuclease RuvC [Flavobacteriaceae bacterium]MCY4254437.1 crossover junction endodeoxyribonuclease RuvC [Flavobacteriaceae bacterium]
MTEKIILGIDPGTQKMGFGAIKIVNNKPSLYKTLELNLTNIKDPHRKLREIYLKSKEQIDLIQPHQIAIEAPFYASNPQSLLKLGRAQGVAIAAVFSKNVTVTEYPPRKVKQSIVGRGDASKEQIAQMLKSLLSLKSISFNYDVSDALAVALCHFYNSNTLDLRNKSYTSWSSFIRDNPQRLISSQEGSKQ